MLTFIIPLLLGTILGFLIRGQPSEVFVITNGKRLAWTVGIAIGGIAIGTPIGLSISSTTGPQIAALLGTGLGLGVFNVLSLSNATYRKWKERYAPWWLIGGCVMLIVVSGFLPNEVRGVFPAYAGNSRPELLINPSEPTSAQLRPLVAADINSYLGIRLGMPKTEVAYLLGAPSKKESDDSMWSYGDSPKWIVFDSEGASMIGCSGDCPSLAGIEINEPEEQAIAKLKRLTRFDEESDGIPPRNIYGWFDSFASGVTIKNIQTNDPNIWIVLELGRVRALVLMTDEARMKRDKKRMDRGDPAKTFPVK